MGVATVFCCGTKFNRASGDIVAETYKLTAAPAPTERSDGRKWINDGPGNVGHAIPRLKEFVTATDDFPVEIREHAAKNWSPSRLGRGGAFGTGWADNVVLTTQWLGLVHAKDPLTRVNLVGWSRGAVTCTMIAHELTLCDRLEFPVNIFAFDPVPGGESDFKSKGMTGDPYTLPCNVDSYVSVLMEQESKPFFSCVGNAPAGKGIQDGKKRVSYPLPGKHGDCVNVNRPSGRIAAHLLHRWLRDHGTLLRKTHERSRLELLECYAELVTSHRKKQPSKQRGPLIRNRMRPAPYWVNLHHRELFQLEAPRVAAFITDASKRKRPSPPDELNRLRTAMPKTWRSLVGAGIVSAK